MDLQLTDNAALVTASSSGLRQASAKTLAREGANGVINGRDNDEVRANVVLPGFQETERIKDLVEQAVERGDYDTYEEELMDWASNPLEWVGDLMVLRNTVTFFSLSISRYINGESVLIDGGSTGANL